MTDETTTGTNTISEKITGSNYHEFCSFSVKLTDGTYKTVAARSENQARLKLENAGHDVESVTQQS